MSKTTTTVVSVLIAIAIVAGVAGILLDGYHPFASVPACVAAANEICPSAEWTADYRKFLALKAQLPQDKLDQATGMAQRLNAAAPSGYQWDEQKQRFVRLPYSIPTAATQTPVAPVK